MESYPLSILEAKKCQTVSKSYKNVHKSASFNMFRQIKKNQCYKSMLIKTQEEKNFSIGNAISQRVMIFCRKL